MNTLFTDDSNLIKIQTDHRRLEIESCENGCEGKPETERKEVGGYPTDVCTKCLEVVCYYKQKQQQKQSKPKKEKSSKPAVKKNESEKEQQIQVPIENVSGKNSLKKKLHIIPMQENLFQQHEVKNRIVDRLGFHPISVWTVEKWMAQRLKVIVGDFGQTREMHKKNINYIEDGGTGASIFNARLAQMIISAYAPMKAKIHDCFAGGGTRAIISALMENQYYGLDLRQGEIDRIIGRAIELGISVNSENSQITLYQGDSTKDYVRFEEGSCNFGLTCPPYHDLEVYTDNPADLSFNKSYDEFIELNYDVLKGCFYVLKPGSFYIWVIGNFRDKDGYLCHYNGDLTKQAEKAGFRLHDELIFDRGQGGALKRAQQFEVNRKSIKTHEYIMIFKKP